MASSSPADTAVQQRTRRAILQAAISAWGRDFSASLADIADRAGVSRSTLHRYYPERQGLIGGAFDEAVSTLERAAAGATARCTGSREELQALLRALVAQGDAVIFLFSDMTRFAGQQGWADTPDPDPEMVALIERAQAEGVVRQDLSAEWLIGVFYSLGYVAAEAVQLGTMSVHEASEAAVRTFFHGVAATQP